MNEICDKCLTCHWYCDDVLEECKGQEEPCHEYSPCMEIRRVGEPTDRFVEGNTFDNPELLKEQ